VHDVIAEALWWMGCRLGTDHPDRAIRITERALTFDAFCETTNELLLDLLVQSGNAPAARQRFEAIDRRFREELGVPPADTVRRPLERPRPTASLPAGALARALLGSARGRLNAGELDRAVETSRRAADVALAVGDPELELASLFLLATTLIHSQSGRSREAKGLLSRALQLATDLGDLASLAAVEREMGFVFAMEPGYGLAEPVLVRSVGHADGAGDDIRAGQATTYLGMCRSDRCDFAAAQRTLEEAVDRLSGVHGLGWQGYAEGMLARCVQRSGDPGLAARIAATAEDHVRRGGWNAVLPWPISREGTPATSVRRGRTPTRKG
jgi:tetratricopeptide (TPR) repeat protein